jgi:hypothetical protein
MDPNSMQDCTPEAVIQVLREQARGLRHSGTALFQHADELDGIADQWAAALEEQGSPPGGDPQQQGGMAGGDLGEEGGPPQPGMRGAPRRR